MAAAAFGAEWKLPLPAALRRWLLPLRLSALGWVGLGGPSGDGGGPGRRAPCVGWSDGGEGRGVEGPGWRSAAKEIAFPKEHVGTNT